MKKEKVKVDLQCPFCGLCKVFKIPPHWNSFRCPSCNQNLFLKWATGVEGEKDEHGYYFHAYEPFDVCGNSLDFQYFIEGE